MPSATACEFQRAALALGFVKRRQTGSHERWTHGDGRSVTMTIAWLLLKTILPRRVGAPLQGAGFNIAYFAWFAAMAGTVS
jgi:hypothetical protein